MTTRSQPARTGPPDAELVAGARRGDREAFGQLVERWQRPLFARALRATRSVADADDLVQETFLKAWQGLARFRDDAAFGGWTLRILANLAADRGRRGQRQVELPDEAAAALPDGRPGPEDTLLAGELERAVAGALEAIPDGRKKEVFRMRFVEGRTVNEIAGALGVHSGTVKVHLFRLARDLRRRVTGRED